MTQHRTSLQRLPLQRYRVQLSQGSQPKLFSAMAEDPTRAVLLCIESKTWLGSEKDLRSDLKCAVHAIDASGVANDLELLGEVDEQAVRQYNRALTNCAPDGGKMYTVFGTYPRCDDRYAAPAHAMSATEAVLVAIEDWRDNNDDEWVDVEFCGIVLGDAEPVDAEYAIPGWSREHHADEERDGEERNTYTVITRWETTVREACGPLAAEEEFDSHHVAAVLCGDVENLWPDADAFLVDWSLERPRRRSAEPLSLTT